MEYGRMMGIVQTVAELVNKYLEGSIELDDHLLDDKGK
jgi:hypothetical protein